MYATGEWIEKIEGGDKKALARAITLVENELPESSALLGALPFSTSVPVIGITGPPGAGKSSVVNAMIGYFSEKGLKTGILAIDPTSPFNKGSLLGDRLRMSSYFNDEKVFIRSIATRGSLGGLSAKTIEICDVMRHAGFDYIMVETVGVGQSEIEISGLADITLLVLVPEAGDEIQQLKSGIMEIADLFVVNKADRPGAEQFAHSLTSILHASKQSYPYERVIKTIATENTGIVNLMSTLSIALPHQKNNKRHTLLAEKAFSLIQHQRMKDINKQQLEKELFTLSQNPGFNLYKYLTERNLI